MNYEAPDFVKVVANVKNSFFDSTKCSKAIGFLHEIGQPFGNTSYNCGGNEIWTETEFAYNCWLGPSADA